MNVLKETPLYIKAIEGMEIIQESADTDDNLHIVGGICGDYVIFLRFEKISEQWKLSEDYFEIEMPDSKITLPKINRKWKK